MKTKRFAISDNPRHQRGFTLMEVMVAAAITLVLFVTFYATLSAGVMITQTSRENLRATQILVNRMEGIRLYTWNQLTNTALLPTSFTEKFYPDGTVADQGITYTGTVTVVIVALTSPASSYSNNLCQVTVNLTWQSTGPVHTRQLSTYCAKYGIQNYVWTSD